MSDLMWGGVPFQIPSVTAMKYLGSSVKVKVGFVQRKVKRSKTGSSL
jgi:hypothetical protein